MFNFIKRLEKVAEDVYKLKSQMAGGMEVTNIDTLFMSQIHTSVSLPKQIKDLNARIKLLESHLNLKYYPASEEKKEARYEEKAEELILNVLTNKTRLMKKLGDRPTQKIKKTKKK